MATIRSRRKSNARKAPTSKIGSADRILEAAIELFSRNGFDGTSTGTFRASGSVFRYEPNAAALEIARDIVARQLGSAWNLPN